MTVVLWESLTAGLMYWAAAARMEAFAMAAYLPCLPVCDLKGWRVGGWGGRGARERALGTEGRADGGGDK